MQERNRYYAGIGSRSTPLKVLEEMVSIAIKLRNKKFILRSGHAEGADQAFETGARELAEVYLPWANFERDKEILARKIYQKPSPKALHMASLYHPAWNNLSDGAKLLHARNCHQVLGYNLDTPVEFIYCWTPDGAESGGTAQAMRIARNYDISIYNLNSDNERQEN